MSLEMGGGMRAQVLVRGRTGVRTHDHLLGDADLGLQIASEVGAEAPPETWTRWTTRETAAGRPPGMPCKVR